MSLSKLMAEKLGTRLEFWTDVDGVLTPQGKVTIYDVFRKNIPGFVKNDGVNSITLVPCDLHGVPIANTIEYLAGFEGESIMEGYRFDPRDGKVVEYLVKLGINVYFISGRNSPCVLKRAKTLGAIPLLGIKDKLPKIQQQSSVPLGSVVFLGDGIQDVEAMLAIKTAGGITVAPADASLEAKNAAVYVSDLKGGEGVFEEVSRSYLKSIGRWPDV